MHNKPFYYMFIVLINMCNAGFSSQREKFSSSTVVVQQGRKTVEQSTHRAADVTQIGSHVTAHETSRKKTREEGEGSVRTWEELHQKSGVKSERDAATRMRDAMGFSGKLTGQPEEGRLTVTNTNNKAGLIAGIPFNPYKKQETNTSNFLCHGGRCEETMG